MACLAAGVGRSTVYEWREQDKAFAAAWDEAMEQACDLLEESARKRAHEGWEEPVFHQGEVCGTVRKYSDTLLIFLLKAHRPEKFRETVRQEHSGEQKLSINITRKDEPQNGQGGAHGRSE